MHKILDKSKIVFLFCSLFFASAFCQGAEQLDKTQTKNAIEDVWDPTRYITIDEIKPGMKAYCLTGYTGTDIEKFDLDVISVVRGVWPGRDAFLVQGTDERFIHSGPVAGCSGTPVYIEGRLAGALAFGWIFSKDPLYGVTPIKDILRVGQANHSESGAYPLETGGYAFDFSVPIDFDKINRQITASRLSRDDNPANASVLPCPLIVSGLPVGACQQLNDLVEPLGFMPVSGLSGGNPPAPNSKPNNKSPHVRLEPGASLAVPLVTGDIKMDAIGTVTEVKGDNVYALGHSFLGGYGPIDLPMATAQVHTVVSNVFRSFKFATSLEIVGALRTDESTSVYGQIGAKPKMIPLTIAIDRYNDTEKRLYNCRLATNKLLTPLMLGSAVIGATLSRGSLPPDHMIEYKVAISLEQAESINFENISTGAGLQEIIRESIVPVAILLNNPYKKVNVKSIDVDVRIVPKNVIAHIWSVDLPDSTVKAGQNLDIEAVVESVLADKKKYTFSFKTPRNLEPGQYKLIVCGAHEYQKFLRKTTPYRFIPQNLTTLVEAINNILKIKRDRLYCLLVLPASGITVEKAELPDLPATKALILQDAKRTLKTRPYSYWVEDSLKTGTVIIDKKTMRITIEK